MLVLYCSGLLKVTVFAVLCFLLYCMIFCIVFFWAIVIFFFQYLFCPKLGYALRVAHLT